MSQLKVNSIVDAAGGSSAVLYGVASPPNSMGFRNRLINSDMRIDQRNAGASVSTPSTATVFVTDRWAAVPSQTNKMTLQQSSVAPTGFKNSLLVTSSSAYSVGSSDYFFVRQNIEGFNVADFNLGTASAITFVLSFWVRSSLTGTFGGSFRNGSFNRSYPFSYTISAANTWEFKTVTVSGDTSGTWATDNTTGLEVDFGLGVGSSFSSTAGTWAGANYLSATGATSVVGTSGATFYITGVQLEAGTVASPFERRDYGRELMMCQRYYAKTFDTAVAPAQATGNFNGGLSFVSQSATVWDAMWKLPVEMRVAPTVITYSPNGASANWSTNGPYTPTVLVHSAGTGLVVCRAGGTFTAGYGFTIHAAASSEL